MTGSIEVNLQKLKIAYEQNHYGLISILDHLNFLWSKPNQINHYGSYQLIWLIRLNWCPLLPSY